MNNPLESAEFFNTYATGGALGGNVNLLTDAGGPANQTPCRCIRVGTVGDLVVVRIDGTSVTIPAACISAGVDIPIKAKQITAAGTTAQKIFVLW